MLVKEKQTRYKVFGPFRFASEANERHRISMKRFWADRKGDGSPEGLEDAVGIYVWTHCKDGARLPWNVGRTDRQGFKARFLQKESGFLLFDREEAPQSIEVFLVALLTPTQKDFGKAKKAGTISTNDWLESMLIRSALEINPNLRNSAKVQKLKKTVVDGYLNDDPKVLSDSAKSFQSLFRK